MTTNHQGYYRFPTIHNHQIVFVAEDDLWQININGGTAKRLTANLGIISDPKFSPDGQWIAFTGREEGNTEIYVMPAAGGPAKRLTYMGSYCTVVAWQGDKIIFFSNYGKAFFAMSELYSIDLEGHEPQKLNYGPAYNIGFGDNGGVVLGRNTREPARWKRYKGGTAGQIWIDADGSGEFYKLVGDKYARLHLNGNLACPLWIGNRIYFIADHEGIGNIYSCLTDGTDLQKHSHHTEYFARNIQTDGEHIIYHAGGNLHLLNIASNNSQVINFDYPSPRIHHSRKFVPAARYLEDYSLNSNGSCLAVVSRGKSFTFGNWEGAVQQQGIRDGVRYRLSRWLNEGKRIVLFSDETEEYRLEIHTLDGSEAPVKLNDLDVGIPYDLKVSPKRDEVIIYNHKHELIWVNLAKGEAKTIDRSEYNMIQGFNWSPDGNYVAYSCSKTPRISIIKIYSLNEAKSYEVTDPILNDSSPSFDPTGKYLYFLSHRTFNPVYDNMHFDLNFPKGMRPYVLTLSKDTPSPLVLQPKGFDFRGPDDDKKETDLEDISIDFEGITERIMALPVAEGIYGDIIATKGKVFYTSMPVEGARYGQPGSKAMLKVFDLKTLEENTYISGISSFHLSADGSALACEINKQIRVISADREEEESLPKGRSPKRKTGWIDLARLKISINPTAEWQQIYKEAWRLQRDYYWVEDMSDIDWNKVFDRYYKLIQRIGSRSEFSDLLWEMQGELGTSHAYESGGDYRPSPAYRLGFLAAEFSYEPAHDAYRITHIVKGDVWDNAAASPLKRPGVNVSEGMLLLAVNGVRLNAATPPYQPLVNQAGEEVALLVADKNGKNQRTVQVKTLPNEHGLRYRDWVEKNRSYVHEKSGGKIGYVHVPNMGAEGYAEFHRYFLTELDYEGLVVDVRFNGGGHVSQLLLEKLARKRVGYDLTRWMGDTSYPSEAVFGHIVALTNESAGSDGDIFSHVFKIMKLGKLIGRRTWGGVIGIWPRNMLADGSMTTQPEFSFWFTDVAWDVENYGTDPDIEVDITPQQYAQQIDPQLDRAIAEIQADIAANPPKKPAFKNRPKLTLPG